MTHNHEEKTMRAVMPEVPPEILAWRKRTGADMWDEMWEGVLHMAPAPNRAHQDFEGALETYLRLHWARPHGHRVYHNVNLALPGGWPDDYRIPDLLLLTPARFGIDHNEYFEGAPDVVVEIRSPGDESYEKLTFYAQLGVPEVWLIDRDSKSPTIHVLQAGAYVLQTANVEGWFLSAATGIELQVGRPGKLVLRLAGDDSTREEVPED
jgi:Uma2 family endonuclease